MVSEICCGKRAEEETKDQDPFLLDHKSNTKPKKLNKKAQKRIIIQEALGDSFSSSDQDEDLASKSQFKPIAKREMSKWASDNYDQATKIKIHKYKHKKLELIKIVNELQSFVEDPEISPDLRKKHKLEISFLKEKQQKVVDKLKAITQPDDLSQ